LGRLALVHFDQPDVIDKSRNNALTKQALTGSVTAAQETKSQPVFKPHQPNLSLW